MNIVTEEEITGARAKELRKAAKLSQPTFWQAVGITQSGGCRYERGNPIPRPVRILIYLHYVVGLPIDAYSKAGIAELENLAALHRAARAIPAN